MKITRVALTVNLPVYKLNEIAPPEFDKIAVRSDFIVGLVEVNGVVKVTYQSRNGRLASVFVMQTFAEIFEQIKEYEV
ncbi:hypothetical protein [Cronobacter phage vB_Cdu_VP8]|nr:hypothetical protein [Cronobacter phage vB_Cdu_VP8]